MINATLQNNGYNRTSRIFRVTSVPEQQSYIAVRLLFEYTSVPWKTWTGLLNSVHLSHWIVRTHCPCTAGITIAGNILCEESFYLSTVSLFIIIIILFGIFMHESSVFLSVGFVCPFLCQESIRNDKGYPGIACGRPFGFLSHQSRGKIRLSENPRTNRFWL